MQVVISDSSCLIDLRKTSLLDAFLRLPYELLGFAYALAESCPGCILLTGDGSLRALARRQKIEVHGVLWVIDELRVHAISATETLLKALQSMAKDPTVRLPQRELAAYIKRYGSVS